MANEATNGVPNNMARGIVSSAEGCEAGGAAGGTAVGARTRELTCVRCPMGCVLSVTLDDAGQLAGVTGNTCRRGLEYAQQEAVDPRRSISAVVWAQGRLEPLSVKTQEPIPKAMIADAMQEIRALRPQPPIEAGQVLVADVAGTGVAVVATKSMP